MGMQASDPSSIRARAVLFLRAGPFLQTSGADMDDTRDRGRDSRDSIDGRIERAKDAALGPHDKHPSRVDELAEATGSISGVLVGAGIGSAAGPLGTLIGGIAGAIGGWWAGRAVSEAASALTREDEEHFRAHFD